MHCQCCGVRRCAAAVAGLGAGSGELQCSNLPLPYPAPPAPQADVLRDLLAGRQWAAAAAFIATYLRSWRAAHPEEA